ncbi:flagellar hook-length control protein FliK [Metabacillus sp. 84]|uniref:flagellar hook-length control protein FliK n=1 Tax=Metabacillus sp. 84 TaxID=3404705 RepID=UPI003CEEE41A
MIRAVMQLQQAVQPNSLSLSKPAESAFGAYLGITIKGSAISQEKSPEYPSSGTEKHSIHLSESEALELIHLLQGELASQSEDQAAVPDQSIMESILSDIVDTLYTAAEKSPEPAVLTLNGNASNIHALAERLSKGRKENQIPSGEEPLQNLLKAIEGPEMNPKDSMGTIIENHSPADMPGISSHPSGEEPLQNLLKVIEGPEMNPKDSMRAIIENYSPADMPGISSHPSGEEPFQNPSRGANGPSTSHQYLDIGVLMESQVQKPVLLNGAEPQSELQAVQEPAGSKHNPLQSYSVPVLLKGSQMNQNDGEATLRKRMSAVEANPAYPSAIKMLAAQTSMENMQAGLSMNRIDEERIPADYSKVLSNLGLNEETGITKNPNTTNVFADGVIELPYPLTEANSEDVGRALTSQVSQRITRLPFQPLEAHKTFVFQLFPEHLGELKVELVKTGSQWKGTFLTENTGLQSLLNKLPEGLAGVLEPLRIRTLQQHPLTLQPIQHSSQPVQTDLRQQDGQTAEQIRYRKEGISFPAEANRFGTPPYKAQGLNPSALSGFSQSDQVQLKDTIEAGGKVTDSDKSPFIPQSALPKVEQFSLFVKTDGPAGNVNQQDLIQQIQKLLSNSRFSTFQSSEKLFLKLYPERLGELRIEIMQSDGKWSAKFTAASLLVKEAIETHIHQLKQGLSGQQIQMEKIEVVQSFASSQKQDDHQQSSGERQREPSQRQRQQEDPDERSFEDSLLEQLANEM